MTTGAGPFLVSRHSLFRGAARCWPPAGLLVDGQLASRRVTPGKPGCGLPLRGYRGPGPVRASVHLSRVLTEAGVAPAVHLHEPAPLAASPTHPVSEFVVAELVVSSWAWRADTHARTQFSAPLDTLGHGGVPAAYTVVEPSGRAGGPVKECTSQPWDRP